MHSSYQPEGYTGLKTLLSTDEIHAGVARLAGEIRDQYAGQSLTVVGVMSGSLVFLADLIRHIREPLRVGVIQARSYRGSATVPGPLEVRTDLLPDIRDRHVLLVDDIFDTGRTLQRLMSSLRELQPASLRAAVLLSKPARHEVETRPDFTVFEIEDVFAVGYGMDYRDAYRNLPHIAALEPEEIQAPPP